jgi:ubiquinone/menaquinone biosynthesis C-methylase UbiE
MADAQAITPTRETDRIHGIYERYARTYDAAIRVTEELLLGDGRAWLCGQARGDVLEIAIGTGRNFPYYPSGVHLTGIDVSPAMLDKARERAAALGMEADLRAGDAQALDFPDASFDTVICARSLCTIPDDRKAVEEAHRVLRPGGQLRLLEHVRSPNPRVRAVERFLDPHYVRR